jgi:glycine/D-amino acid oxidase-like deaminating enzyme
VDAHLTPSFWLSSLDGLSARPTLPGDREADIAIVGAGYTGLWTAYYLAAADPSLRIAVLEAEYAGFGASGRNGGWCSGLFPVPVSRLARRYGRDRAVALQHALADTVDEVGRVAAA